ncbi:unnamed protein product [Adineta ricciae]|uniref:WWE domain-containing protein n=1 Tax=Adineta ricciae TaxID=249248 RepID=A0A814CDG5_ADIRI|nr:unnamed protein product [Adineta ricciae]
MTSCFALYKNTHSLKRKKEERNFFFSKTQWQTKTNAVPDWKPYDSSDNNKIEQAFKAGKNKADLANHAIHLKERMQVHKADFNKQRPVKREVKT